MTPTKSNTQRQIEALKLADIKYPIEEVLRRRCSTMAFSDRRVEMEKLRQLFEAARWAPSSFNEQPWSFLLTTKNENPEDYQLLLSTIVERNREWVQHAPVLVLSVAKRHFDRGGKVNHYSAHDVGLATENLTIQATALDLFVHLIAGFDHERARTLFSIPEGHEPVCVVAIGYLGSFEDLPSNLQDEAFSPRQRRPFRNFVFAGQWGRPTDLIPD